MTVHQNDPTLPNRSCEVTVAGPRRGELGDEAIRQAALFLWEAPSDLYVRHIGTIREVERSKYRKNLNVPAPVIRWSATVTVCLLPSVVEARSNGSTPGAPSPARKFKVIKS